MNQASENRRKESCGNDGSVESEESQRRAFHPFHESLGNLAKKRRDSHIPTAPATRRMEKWKTKTRFPTFPPPRILSFSQAKQPGRRRSLRSAEELKSSCR